MLERCADRCWTAIISRNLEAFAQAYRDSFDAQVAMFPAMVQGSVPYYIEKYRDSVLAWKMPGAGGGGYLACVVDDSATYVAEHPEAIALTIRRAGM